ncbi:hypothetical protein NE857_01715 [Nocardiopsis exhalans]|uniref:Uncharacterized protein n=1 Tax=Nocardiopsis exhalans TaxID=163604 RepID=A0ABY5D9I6_9ACTN|nr:MULTISPECIES: hypothetical protein [Nocardiopsis]USY20406.1 hypothetical protein NE857_01715 [Nocardiopsis exhalans]
MDENMADLLLLLTGTGFIALCAVYVRMCQHLLGPDPEDPHPDPVGPAGARGDATDHAGRTGVQKTVTS